RGERTWAGNLPQTVRMSARLLSARPEIVAPRLLGSVVTSDVGGERVSVRLTEVEAYGGAGEDPGSHAFRGPTPRNATMFGPAAHV
ncbi:MAG: DNA-3-methyladenine glycosylase, partial [Actinomycetota bacterium]